MSENFMTAGTQIEALVEKKDQLIEKAASLLFEAVKDRMRQNQVKKSMSNDILNILKGFSEEEKNIILSKTIMYLASNQNPEYHDSYIDPTTNKEWQPKPNKNKSFKW